jgi:hypothetical protein
VGWRVLVLHCWRCEVVYGGLQTYISRLAWDSCFFFSASISPAIWFFFLFVVSA